MDVNTERSLKIFAAQIRMNALTQIASAGKGHVGGSMSASDLMAVLYGYAMRYKPDEPRWEGRDRLIMSKGHSGCCLYAALQLKGFFPASWIRTLNRLGTSLPSHCDRQKTPGIDMSTGSLGQGLSVAIGIAHAGQLRSAQYYTYCVMGDGEMQEGQVWEALMYAGRRRVPRLIAFVDLNGKQVDGMVEDILPISDIGEHAKLFGWYTESIDGHDVAAIAAAIDRARAQELPALIGLKTIKGKDCVFAEHLAFNHGMDVTGEQLREATGYLEKKIAQLEGSGNG